jgi:DNA-binding NtrC family response regulator
MAYHWPGNIRQLENCIEQAVIFSPGRSIDTADIRGAIDLETAAEASHPAVPGSAVRWADFPGQSLRDLEAWYIRETLKRFGGNRTRTARFIGLSLRGLQYKLKRYDLASSV